MSRESFTGSDMRLLAPIDYVTARRAAVFSLLVAALLGAGCAPSISPLYRDYDLRKGEGDHIRERIVRALGDTRWRVVPSSAPLVVATDTVTIRRFGLYRVEVALEIAPVGDRYVRVLVHPYRRYFTGARRKIPYFKRRLRRTILPELARAFEAQGLHPIGSAMERDRASGAR